MHSDGEQNGVFQDDGPHWKREEQTERRRVVEPAQVGGVPRPGVTQARSEVMQEVRPEVRSEIRSAVKEDVI